MSTLVSRVPYPCMCTYIHTHVYHMSHYAHIYTNAHKACRPVTVACSAACMHVCMRAGRRTRQGRCDRCTCTRVCEELGLAERHGRQETCCHHFGCEHTVLDITVSQTKMLCHDRQETCCVRPCLCSRLYATAREKRCDIFGIDTTFQ